MKDKYIGRYFRISGLDIIIKPLEKLPTNAAVYFCAVGKARNDFFYYGHGCTTYQSFMKVKCPFRNRCDRTHHCMGMGNMATEVSQLEGMIWTGE
jgi:hypothetical protein